MDSVLHPSTCPAIVRLGVPCARYHFYNRRKCQQGQSRIGEKPQVCALVVWTALDGYNLSSSIFTFFGLAERLIIQFWFQQLPYSIFPRILDDHLLLNTYLVQEHVSNCDIVLFCDLLLAFQQVFDDAFLRNFVNLKRWFKTIANQENIASVIGGHKSLAKF